MEHLDKPLECVCCKSSIGDPEEDGAVEAVLYLCSVCAAKRSDKKLFVCAVCNFFLGGYAQNSETDNDLIKLGMLKPGETKKQKIRELKRNFKNRVGVDFHG